MGALKVLVKTLFAVAFVGCDTGGEVVAHLRRLAGSNCVLIERGDAPPYYKCIGCVIQEAMGCIDDMRTNKSQNSPLGCDLGTLVGAYDSSHCCPRFAVGSDGKKNLQYMGSAYPLAIHCIENVGCSGTSIYNELVEECQAVCNGELDQNGYDACFASFNSSLRLQPSLYVTFILIVITMLSFTIPYPPAAALPSLRS